MNTPSTTQTAGQTTHSPLPWFYSWPKKAILSCAELGKGTDYTPSKTILKLPKDHAPEDEANAAFIVLAANSHDKLVEALVSQMKAARIGYAAVCGLQSWTDEQREELRLEMCATESKTLALIASL